MNTLSFLPAGTANSNKYVFFKAGKDSYDERRNKYVLVKNINFDRGLKLLLKDVKILKMVKVGKSSIVN